MSARTEQGRPWGRYLGGISLGMLALALVLYLPFPEILRERVTVPLTWAVVLLAGVPALAAVLVRWRGVACGLGVWALLLSALVITAVGIRTTGFRRLQRMAAAADQVCRSRPSPEELEERVRALAGFSREEELPGSVECAADGSGGHAMMPVDWSLDVYFVATPEGRVYYEFF